MFGFDVRTERDAQALSDGDEGRLRALKRGG